MRKETRFTCTACAGTLLLEFGTLSRLTGNPIYEQKASHAVKRVFGEPYHWVWRVNCVSALES